MTTHNLDFKHIRQWRGSQHQAFEELCYQLRDPTPNGAELVKTGNPDGGYEWYFMFGDGSQWGWQAKYSFDIDNLLKGMETSLKTVVNQRPDCRQLTFCIPFDLPDSVEAGKRKSARQKFEDRKQSWIKRIPGADRVHIELWSEGDLLERLVQHPGRRGIARFFWDTEIFSPEWCAGRMAVVREIVRKRYRPELHVDVPVSFALEGLALTENYWRRFRGAREAVVEATDQILVSRYKGLGVTEELRNLKKKLAQWQHAMPKQTTLPERLDTAALREVTRECLGIIRDASPPIPRRGPGKRTEPQRREEDRVKSLVHSLGSLEYALEQVEILLLHDASKAADNGALLLRGSAGQGKTHLFFDAGFRAIETGQPAVVVLGGSLSGRNVWTEIGQQLGLAAVGSEEVVSAMQAAAEVSDAPFLLLVDALNEAADPAAWRAELPRLLAEVSGNPWISVAVSVRSTFLTMVLPPDGLGNVTEVEHPGFDGRELEATERIFDHFELEQPRIPLLTPEFTNPLFLILYCEGLVGMGLTAPPLGGEHLSVTFRRYLASKEQRIVQHLRMDPDLHPVRAAIGCFSRALVEANSDTMPYLTASDLISGFGNASDRWPDTLFEQLLSEDVLCKDAAWDPDADEPRQVVRFTYQQFADYQVVSILLEPFAGDADSLRQALSPGEPLRQTILDAPPNWVEALAVLVPERFGIELEDATGWDLDNYLRYVWDSALVTSVSVRCPSAVTKRTRELLGEAQRRNWGLLDSVLEAWLSVATQPEHPLNAYTLHETLMGMSMPERDEVWGQSTYYTLDSGGPLDRLIRWASRNRRPDCPSEVVELAAITLAWTFTSPNRKLRDQATKALAQLLSDHLTVLPSLIRRFAGVNDPYLVERLAVACHGAVLCGSISDPQAVVRAAEAMKRVVFADDQPPNFVTRDAVRGIYEWCFHNGWVDEPTYSGLLPPHSSAPPEEPPTDEEIRRDYDVVHGGPGRRRALYADIYWSVGDMGDFGRYIIEFAVHRFTPHRLVEGIPMDEQRAQFDSAWAQRWVFQRVISLGWTPERFAAFDEQVNYRQSSRTDHKPERFGKKYQWIAFHELMARIADNYHMRPAYGGELEAYVGPWELLSRDIDPTLPPPLRTRNEDDEVEAGKTFPEGSDLWWVPDGPRYRDDDPPTDDGWGTDPGDIPEFEPLVTRSDGDGTKWVVLHAWYNWNRGHPWRRITLSRRGEIWSHIYSWLVRPEQREAVVGYLEKRTLMNRWMPEGVGNTDAAYLGELPWAISREDPEDVWQPVASRWDEDPTGLEVSPAWEAYEWEGNIRDCSIDKGVQAWYPAPLLLSAGALTWRPGTREWKDPAGVTVAQFVENSDHSLLLVREDWLERTLRGLGLEMVFGWLGEKQLLETDPDRLGPEIVGGWTEINGVASMDGRQWRFGQRRLETRSVSNDDADISSGSDGINGTDIIRQMLRDSCYGE